MKALSIRQPWAWLIVNGWKDVENRKWATKFRGPVFIHASKTMTKNDFAECRIFLSGFSEGWDIIGFLGDGRGLERGGIIGEATLVDCVQEYESRWFVGPYGFVLSNPKPVDFVPCLGRLNFFDVNPPDALSKEKEKP